MLVLNSLIYSKQLDDADCAATYRHMIGKGDHEWWVGKNLKGDMFNP